MINRNELSTLSLALLGLVSQGPMSGYDARKVFATTPLGVFSTSPGAIYPALARLERDGLIEGTVENVSTLRPRKVYALTPEGRRVLKRTLKQPVTRDDIASRQGYMLLRFVFMEANVPREDALRFLADLASQCDEYVAELEELWRELGPQIPLYSRFAMERGIAGYRMDAEWARRVISELEGEQA